MREVLEMRRFSAGAKLPLMSDVRLSFGVCERSDRGSNVGVEGWRRRDVSEVLDFKEEEERRF